MRRLLPKNKEILDLILIVLLTLPAIFSLLRPGFFPSHDGEWMVIRLTDFHRSFVAGQIPVRWAARLNYGFGYPVFNFLYPLSFYLGELFHLLGFSFVWSVKLVFIFGFLFSAFFMYLFCRQFWGRLGGLVSAILYVYTPYRFLDTYVRGSIGEALAFVFPPLIFFAVQKIKDKWNNFYFVIGGLAFAGLMASHNTMAMLFTFIFFGFCFGHFFIFRQKNVLWRQLAVFPLGLLLACFFWLPALFDKRYVYFDQVMVSNFFVHFPTLRQLLVPCWGFGPSLPLSDQDTLSFQVGLANLGVVSMVVLIFSLKALKLRLKTDFIKKNFEILWFLFVFLFSFFSMLEVSSCGWQVVFVANLIQFPWRLLSLTTFSSAFLAGAIMSLLKGRFKFVAALGVLTVAILLNYQYTKPEYFVDHPESFYATNEGTTTVANEYMPIWVKKPPTTHPQEKTEIISGRGKISRLNTNSKMVKFDLLAETAMEIQINIVYFPGWKVKINRQAAAIDYSNENGLIRLKTTPGNYQIEAKFEETPIRLLSDLISIVSFVFIAKLFIREVIKSAKDK